MPSCGCWFQKEEKNSGVYFSFMILSYPTTSFTTRSELVWAQETWNISAFLHIHTLLEKAWLQFGVGLAVVLEDLLVQVFAGVCMETKRGVILWKTTKINCVFAEISTIPTYSVNTLNQGKTGFISTLKYWSQFDLYTISMFGRQVSFYKISWDLTTALTKCCMEIAPTLNAEICN